MSEGTFHRTVGLLMRTWGFAGGGHHVPSPDDIREALELVGYQHVRPDAEGNNGRFDHPGVELDPGGVGKGYAVDRMVEILPACGIHSGLVAASGSSIFGLPYTYAKSSRLAHQTLPTPGTTGTRRCSCFSKICPDPSRVATKNHSARAATTVTRISWIPAAGPLPKTPCK